MDIDIALVPPAVLGAFESALDREFVAERGRRGRLRSRYPLAFAAGGGCEFLVASRRGELVACLATRSFEWRTPQRPWRGVMIGFVYTTPAARGAGLGSRLLNAAREEFARRSCEFAVLWSRLAGFYEAAGFQRADCGTFGRWSASHPTVSALPGIALRELPATVLAELEDLRRTRSPCALERRAPAWQTCPLPADEVRVLYSGPAGQPRTYVLFGVAATTRIVYEIVGDPADCAALWTELAEGAQEVLVNESVGSATHQWLTSKVAMDWQLQNLALWAPLTAEAREVDFGAWYLPWFDRL